MGPRVEEAIGVGSTVEALTRSRVSSHEGDKPGQMRGRHDPSHDRSENIGCLEHVGAQVYHGLRCTS